MAAKAPRTLPWALLTSVSLHALAASWIGPVGVLAVNDRAHVQALELVLPPPRERAAEAPRADALAEQPRAVDKSTPIATPRKAVRQAQPTRSIPVLAATNAPGMVLPATEMTESLPAAAETSSPVAASTVVAVAPTAAAAPIFPPSFHADYLDNPKPSYPAAARRRGLQGETRLEVLVAANGLPQEVKIARSSGHEELDEAARVAVKHWRFVPARRGEEKVDGWVAVPIAFRLDR